MEMAGKKLTQEERIAERNARVAARRNKDVGQFKGGDRDAENEKAQISQSKAQITKSRAFVDETKATGEELISDVRVNRDFRENVRRRNDEKKRSERMKDLESELLESTRINREIEMEWAQIAKKDIPQELYQEIAVQYKAASKLLASKDDIVKNLQTELKVKDEDYVELLAQHEEDISTMVKRMKEQFGHMLGVSQQELDHIEEVSMQERTELLEGYKAEIQALFDKRQKMEVDILEAKQSREEEFQAELAKIRSTDAEDYNHLKVTLENNIQLLEQQLEEMRATYQLNTEKLEYNHAVLEERDAENKQTVEHHHKRIRRLKEALSSHKMRFHKQDAKFKNENQDLTEEYKRITEQFKDLQKKFRHFEMVDNKKYREVWAMNEEACMKIVRKVLKADELIHSQILGLKYVPTVVSEGMPISIEDITSAQIFNATDTISSSSNSAGSGVGGAGEKGGDDPNPNAASNSISNQLGIAGPNSNTTEGSAIAPKSKFSNHQIKMVMSLLGGETSFLVDARLKDSLRGQTDEEQDMYKVDAILSSLGVEDHEDLDELVEFFYDDPKADKPSVHPNDIIKVIRDFAVKRQQSKTKASGTGGSSQPVAVKTDAVSSEKRARKRDRERRFWKRLGEVIPDKTSRLWEALESTLIEYNLLLEERAKVIDETTELARQNEELKILLQEYLGSKINQDLQIPPTRLIRVDD
mmetsp:Transcript_13357/g.25936  ORF Transcript_13357/g.25936 Transcript_13357/m.25936 type:complete len:701 (+) Transcript_13357:61-2163(+)|eukprot:CAMPEP_0175107618 /NCGR_PEP_ID=MMETSP0086_2-20121207/12038_1 /TAXON_ID=136419 /ORGANISM="Unknown Unknown, Strain D1" /LENGTH=700 /DNA_ID=CAMNT_0016384451 /DNA_START=34 /DNA_END=2136 /DNA_ORIENTATION=-